MKNLRHLTDDELLRVIEDRGEKKFRFGQIKDWIWKKNAASIHQMLNLSKDFRQSLLQDFYIPKLDVNHSQFSTDGTIKIRFETYDHHFIEGVLIPTENRMTACVSSQIGCSLSCKFCATGYMDRERNLTFDEIYDQVFILNEWAKEHFERHLSNIVYMGMGEPLLNQNEVMKSIEKITSEEGLGMSSKRITLSTAGIAKGIKKLADEEVKFQLALSLHAANDKKRNKIMPINESNNLKVLIEALDYYFTRTKNPVTFEYILFSDFNADFQDADELIKICRRIPSKVNIIEYNPIPFTDFSKPDADKTDAFMNYLAKHKINARLRRSRGKDIDGACGQLAIQDK